VSAPVPLALGIKGPPNVQEASRTASSFQEPTETRRPKQSVCPSVHNMMTVLCLPPQSARPARARSHFFACSTTRNRSSWEYVYMSSRTYPLFPLLRIKQHHGHGELHRPQSTYTRVLCVAYRHSAGYNCSMCLTCGRPRAKVVQDSQPQPATIAGMWRAIFYPCSRAGVRRSLRLNVPTLQKEARSIDYHINTNLRLSNIQLTAHVMWNMAALE
jgi:hypothetical protein